MGAGWWKGARLFGGVTKINPGTTRAEMSQAEGGRGDSLASPQTQLHVQ